MSKASAGWLVSAIPSHQVVSQPFAPLRRRFGVGRPFKVRGCFRAGAGQAVVGGWCKMGRRCPGPYRPRRSVNWTLGAYGGFGRGCWPAGLPVVSGSSIVSGRGPSPTSRSNLSLKRDAPGRWPFQRFRCRFQLCGFARPRYPARRLAPTLAIQPGQELPGRYNEETFVCAMVVLSAGHGR